MFTGARSGQSGLPLASGGFTRSSKQMALVAAAALTCCFLQSPATAQTNGTPAPAAELESWLAQTEASVINLDNYTAVFHRVELVGGQMIPEEVAFVKFKAPFKIYMLRLKPTKGQETVYVQGVNGNRILAHTTGIAGLLNVNLEPTSARAMKTSRHPITDAGISNLVVKITSNVRRALQAGELVCFDHGQEVIYGRTTRQWEGVLSKDPSKGYYCYRCIVNLDLETKLPIKTQIFDWDNRLIECYTYEDLKLNPGLTDKDFDPNNPDYHF
jgi:outer membrane lipoprotein-sorting protein